MTITASGSPPANSQPEVSSGAMSHNVLSGTRLLVAAAALLLAACAGSDEPFSDAASEPTITVVSTTSPALAPTIKTTAPGPTTSTPPATTIPATTTTAPATTTTSTTAVPNVPPAEGELAVFDFAAAQLAVGTSIEGRPITADRYGTPGGRRVLVIGVIHGNEDAGVAIVDELRQSAVPEGVELWLIESMNPDGQAAQERQNANQVDLNRNFPHKWGIIGEPGDSQYAGSGPDHPAAARHHDLVPPGCQPRHPLDRSRWPHPVSIRRTDRSCDRRVLQRWRRLHRHCCNLGSCRAEADQRRCAIHRRTPRRRPDSRAGRCPHRRCLDRRR